MAETDTAELELIDAADFHSDPHRYYDRWREYGPVRHVKFTHNHGVECWVVVGYAEARAALADPRLLKNTTDTLRVFRRLGSSIMSTDDAQSLNQHMLNSDPPDHTRLRRLVNKAFTTRRVAALRPRIEQITDELLTAMTGRDEVDLLQAFAIPLPVTVICELLGVPFEDREAFQAWTKILVGAGGPMADRERASSEMTDYLANLLSRKRVQPAEDLLSVLANDAGEDRLTEPELIAMAFLLLVAGHETTVNLIGNGTHALLRDRTRFEALRADPAGIPGAIEEFLRLDGPVGWSTVRHTAEPITIGDTEIPAGELVYVALPAAAHDPARFADPHTLDLSRDASGHVAFGYGIHFCVGAPLARMEATVAFTALLDRFPDLTLAPDFTPRWQHSTLIRGLTTLPVRPHG